MLPNGAESELPVGEVDGFTFEGLLGSGANSKGLIVSMTGASPLGGLEIPGSSQEHPHAENEMSKVLADQSNPRRASKYPELKPSMNSTNVTFSSGRS